MGISCQFSHPKKSLTSFYWIRTSGLAVRSNHSFQDPKANFSRSLRKNHGFYTPNFNARDPFAHFSKVKWIIIHPSTDSRAQKRESLIQFSKIFSLGWSGKLPIHYFKKRQMHCVWKLNFINFENSNSKSALKKVVKWDFLKSFFWSLGNISNNSKCCCKGV